MTKLNFNSIIKKLSVFLIFLFLLTVKPVFSQMCTNGASMPVSCEIAPVSVMLISGEHNKEFKFDSFGKYAGGMTLNGSTVLKIKVQQLAIPVVSCQWKLVMQVYTGDPLGTDWETMASYGNGPGMNKPPINHLKVRVNNACSTPANAGDWQQFQIAPVGNEIAIIDPNALTPSGTCTPECQTNAAGSYLQNYNEYVFNIDYRIIPQFEFDPGLYELRLNFCLYEK